MPAAATAAAAGWDSRGSRGGGAHTIAVRRGKGKDIGFVEGLQAAAQQREGGGWRDDGDYIGQGRGPSHSVSQRHARWRRHHQDQTDASSRGWATPRSWRGSSMERNRCDGGGRRRQERPRRGQRGWDVVCDWCRRYGSSVTTPWQPLRGHHLAASAPSAQQQRRGYEAP